MDICRHHCCSKSCWIDLLVVRSLRPRHICHILPNPLYHTPPSLLLAHSATRSTSCIVPFPLVLFIFPSYNATLFGRNKVETSNQPRRKKYICQRFDSEGNALSQLLPHHLRIRSGPCSWYSFLDIQVLFKSEVRLNLAIPCQASNAGFLALIISNDISGGSIGRSVACNRGTRPGSWDGAPVRNTFFTKESQYLP